MAIYSRTASRRSRNRKSGRPQSRRRHLVETLETRVLLAASPGLPWTQPVDLTDTFGKTVALQGNTVVVGDPSNDRNGDNSGGAFVSVQQPPTVTETLFTDSFESGGGTEGWAGIWVEDGQNDWFRSRF